MDHTYSWLDKLFNASLRTIVNKAGRGPGSRVSNMIPVFQDLKLLLEFCCQHNSCFQRFKTLIGPYSRGLSFGVQSHMLAATRSEI